MLSSIIIFGLSTPTFAAEADLEAFTLSSEVEVIPLTDLDSGWWPESGPVRIRTMLQADGVAGMTIEGNSILEPSGSDTTYRLEASEETAEVELDISIFASLHLNLDVAGYTYDGVLAEKGFDITESQTINTFAYAADGGQQVDFIVDTKEMFEIEQGILPLVEVVVTASITPTALMEYATTSIVADGFEFTSADQIENATGAAPTSIAASGQMNSLLELVIDGHAEVCITWVDCYGDFDFDFPLDPMEHSQTIDFAAVPLNHSLPSGNNSTGPNGSDLPASDQAPDNEKQPVSDKSNGGAGCSTVDPRSDLMLPLLSLFGIMLVRTRRQGA